MQTIDQDYQVLKTLGQGLAGEVYLVQKGRQKLALKLLKQAIANLNPQEAAAHFKAEFSILKQLSHPHIAKILDFGTDPATGRHYYTSEFVSGGNLYDATRALPPERLEELFIQALRALEYLHTHRIPHFDLKPENLLLQEGEQVKIIDFGMAGFRPRGQLAGTPAYMAPEIVLGNSPDTRADLYSLGVTFYECAVGKNPFAAKSLSEMLRRQETLRPTPAHEANPAVSPALSETLAQLMQKNPADRPATAGNALRLLARLSGRKISLETEATSLSYLPNETQLIGRAAEMSKFQACFDAVFRGEGAQARLVLVSGAEGLGKTRLLKEIRFHAQLAGVRTQNVAGAELPEIHEASCLMFDDLTAAEARKLALSLLSLKRPVLAVAATAEDPGELPDATRLDLKPFGKAEIREYLAALTGLPNPPEALAEELERRSQGSPRFLTELLEEVIRRGSLFDENGRWTAENIEDLGVDFSAARASETLEASLARDFAKLDQPARELLTWMSLHYAPVSAELLSEVSNEEDVFYWVLELLNQGYLRRDEGSQSYQIANPYLKSWIERQMPPEEARRRHAAWAAAFAKRDAEGDEALHHLGRGGAGAKSREALFELARRLSRKGLSQASLDNLRLAEPLAADDVEAATKIRLKIGEELISLNRVPEALAHFDRLREDIKKLPSSAGNVPLKVSAYEHLGAAYLRSHALEKAKASFHAALTLMDEFEGADPVRRLVNENYLGRIRFLEGDLKEAEAIFAQSYARQKKELSAEQQRGVVNNDLGAVLMAQGRHEEAGRWFAEELEFHARNRNEVLQARCLYQLGEIRLALKDYARSIEAFQRCIELAKGQKNFEMLLRAYNGLGNLHHLRHEYQDSLKYYERALAIAQRVQDLQSLAGIETNIGGILNSLDRPQEAVSHLKVVVDLVGSLGTKGAYEQFFLCSAKLELGDVLRRLRDFDAAESALREAWRLAEGNETLAGRRFPIRLTEAKLEVDRARLGRAREILVELKKGKLDADQSIEVAKLSNLLESGIPAEREPAVTQAAIEPAARATQASVYFGAPAENEYAKLLQLTRFINAETNLDFVLKSVLQYALELSGAERGLILLLDERDALEVRASINTAVNPNLTEISSKVAEQALKTGEMVESDDASQDGRFNEYQSVMILKLRSILCLPIHSRNKTVGVLYLDHRYRPGAFRKDRYPLLQAFCDQAGIAIENAKLFERYERAQAELRVRLEKAEEEAGHYHELLGEGAGKLPTKYAYENIVARSKPMYEVFKLLDKITETNISVFINGETGTGKELIAKALHYNNKARAQARFVAINCGGIPPNLIESELFGYKAGAFTGATKDKKGLFVEADGGTLFMDEVAELDMALQVKLLRALQEGEVIPVGDSKPVKFDVRVVSASHKNLEDLIAKGQFREDLFYRICQIRIPLPPLRERREDIPPLVERFAANYAKEHGMKKAPKVSGGLMKRLLDYDWPGNIRELENTIRVACALAEGGELTPKALPEHFGKRAASLPRAETTAVLPPGAAGRGEEEAAARIDAHNRYDPRRTWEDYEKVIFAKAYAAAGFKPIGAAQSLDVSMATFYKRIKDFDLNEKGNPLYQDGFVLADGKTLREYLEDIFWAAYVASGEKAYTAIKWLDVSQGHFYNVLKKAKERHRPKGR